MANSKTVKPEKSRGPETLPPAKKSLGQNFLNDRDAAHKIVDGLGDISQKAVVEIGPGRGVLTGILIARSPHIIAIELDRVLAAQLRMKCANVPNIEVIEADVLDVDFASLLGPRPGTTVTGLTPRPVEKVRVVGNIPYYITSDILLRLFECHQFFDVIVLMVQKEVADRIAARPGTSEYGLLSATCQLYAKVEKLFTLPPAAFSPPPKVHSSVLRLTIEPRFDALQVAPEEFVNFLKLSFGQKRKTLANNLKGQYEASAIKKAMDKAKVKADVRAEALTLEKAAAVFKALGRTE